MVTLYRPTFIKHSTFGFLKRAIATAHARIPVRRSNLCWQSLLTSGKKKQQKDYYGSPRPYCMVERAPYTICHWTGLAACVLLCSPCAVSWSSFLREREREREKRYQPVTLQKKWVEGIWAHLSWTRTIELCVQSAMVRVHELAIRV
jgi:hypothetical protein